MTKARLSPLFLRVGSIWIVFALLLATLAFIPAVHAAQPVINNDSGIGNCLNCASRTTSVTVAAKGDLIVLIYLTVYSDATAGIHTSTDTFSDSFRWAVNNSGWAYSNTPYFGYIGIQYAVAKSSGALTITTTSTKTMASWNTEAFDIGPANTFQTTGNVCLATSTTAYVACNNPVTFSGDVFLIGLEYGSGMCTCNPGQSGFTAPNGQVEYSGQSAGSGVVSPTAFPFANQNAPAANFVVGVIGAVFNFSTTAGLVQSQTIGSCPSSPPGTFTPANSTMYLFTANALGFEVVNNATFALSSVSASSVNQYVQLVILAARFSGSVSAGNPLYVIYSKVYAFTGGSGAQRVNTQIGVSLNNAMPIGSGNTWAAALIGTSKTVLDTGSIGGMTTLASNAASTAEPLGTTFTSLGSSTATQACLLVFASYQSSITTTATTTATSTVTTGNNGANQAVSEDNLLLGVIVLLGPSLLIAGVTKSLWGGILGAVLGLCIGVFAGFLPLWTVAAVVIVVIAALFFARTSGAGGGV